MAEPLSEEVRCKAWCLRDVECPDKVIAYVLDVKVSQLEAEWGPTRRPTRSLPLVPEPVQQAIVRYHTDRGRDRTTVAFMLRKPDAMSRTLTQGSNSASAQDYGHHSHFMAKRLSDDLRCKAHALRWFNCPDPVIAYVLSVSTAQLDEEWRRKDAPNLSIEAPDAWDAIQRFIDSQNAEASKLPTEAERMFGRRRF